MYYSNNDNVGIERSMNKLALQSNVFSPVIHRYSLALAEINTDTPNILDVGGYTSRKTIIDSFFQEYSYTSLNVGSVWYQDVSSDYNYDGFNIPFESHSFDYVISVDTLEHVAKEHRFHMLQEIVRVSAKRAIVVTPFRLPDEETDERYILAICKQFEIIPPPSIVEHEHYGLPLLSDIEHYTLTLNGTYKFATDKKDYWSLQTAMLWNTISLNGNSEKINRALQSFQEKLLMIHPYLQEAKKAYRCVLVFNR